MNTEDYVSFETAKLLKEKGFDEQCIGFYTPEKELHFTFLGETNSTWLDDSISAPTLQMAMKWLREVHKMYIQVEPLVPEYYEKDEYVYRFQYKRLKHIPTYDKMSYIDDIQYITYEKACEEAIKYCLEHLI